MHDLLYILFLDNTNQLTHVDDITDYVDSVVPLDRVKVIIGGAPVTQAYAEQIGADGYAADAATGVDVAKKLLDL